MFSYALWGACKAVEVCIVLAIFYRREWPRWKWLGIYCMSRTAVDVASFAMIVTGHNKAFAWLFWSTEPIFILLQVGILATIYWVVLEGFKVAPRKMKQAIYWTYVIFLAVFGFASAGGRNEWMDLGKITLAGSRVLQILFAATLILTIAYSTAFGLKLSRRVLLIDIGLCFGTVSGICWYALHLLYPSANPALRDMAARIAYFVTVCIWLCAFVCPLENFDLGSEVRSQLARLSNRWFEPRRSNVESTTV
jgi:hypothetical protein